MNVWESVIDYCNNKIGEVGTRKELIHFVRARINRQYRINYRQFSTVDCYKNYLIRAGYIHNIRSNGVKLLGKFFIPKKIDPTITTKQVRDKAYNKQEMLVGWDSTANKYAYYGTANTDMHSCSPQQCPECKQDCANRYEDFLTEKDMTI